jgi:hypothetical protein
LPRPLPPQRHHSPLAPPTRTSTRRSEIH